MADKYTADPHQRRIQMVQFVDDNGEVMEFVGAPGVTNFIALQDVPQTYIGNGGKIVSVSPSEDGLTFEETILLEAGTPNVVLDGGLPGILRINVYETIYSPRPSNSNLLAWTFEPMFATLQQTLSTGVMYMTQMRVPKDIVVSGLIYHTKTLGTSLVAGQNWVGIYDTTGAQLGVSVDQTTNWGSGTVGAETATFTTPVALSGGPDVSVYIATLCNGATGVQLSRASSDPQACNMGLLQAQGYRFGSNPNTGLTTLPATIDITTLAIASCTFAIGAV